MADNSIVDMTSDLTRNSRVHVGNLSPGFIADAVKALFVKCGNILGISPKTNYMFIQFATEDGAKNAIKLSKKIQYLDKRLTVKTAKSHRSNKTNTSSGSGSTGTTTSDNNALYWINKNIMKTEQEPECYQCEIITRTETLANQFIDKKYIDPLLNFGIPSNVVVRYKDVQLDDLVVDLFEKGCTYAIFLDDDFNETHNVKLEKAGSTNALSGPWDKIVQCVINDFTNNTLKELFDKVLEGYKLSKENNELLILFFQMRNNSLIKRQLQQQQQQQQQQLQIQQQQQQLQIQQQQQQQLQMQSSLPQQYGNRTQQVTYPDVTYTNTEVQHNMTSSDNQSALHAIQNLMMAYNPVSTYC